MSDWRITLLDIYRASEMRRRRSGYIPTRRAWVPRQPRPEARLSDLLSQAQKRFEQSLATTTLADLVREIRRSEVKCCVGL